MRKMGRILSFTMACILLFLDISVGVFAQETANTSMVEKNIMESIVKSEEIQQTIAEEKTSEEEISEEEMSEEETPEEEIPEEKIPEEEIPGEETPKEDNVNEETPVVSENTVQEAEIQATNVSGECGNDLTWQLSGGILTISGTGDMYDYSSIVEAPWSSYKDSITKIKFQEGITSIGEYAFYRYEQIAGELTFPSTLEEIGGYAFVGCENITGDLEIPDKVTVIGELAFEECSGLNGNLVLPYGLESIGTMAFQFCNFRGSLNIPDSVTYIGTGAFSNCKKFTGTLKIPNNLTYIGDSAFLYCIGFTGKLEIPKKVESIGNYAFSMCTGLTGLSFAGNKVKTIGESAFEGCEGLTGTLILPESVTTIGKSAFYACRKLSGDLKLPNSVTSIGSYAFCGCSNLNGQLVLPKNLKELGAYAFYACYSLTGDVTIPANLKTLDEYVFSNCIKLKNIYIHRKVTGIKDGAFSFLPTDMQNLSVTIHTPKDSYAWKWAKGRGFAVKEWDDSSVLHKEFIIQVVNQQTDMPISGVDISINNTCYTTKKDGKIKFTGKKETYDNVSFVKDGYQTKIIQLTLKPYEVNKIYMTENSIFSIDSPKIKGQLKLEDEVKVAGKKFKWLDMDYKIDLGKSTEANGLKYKIPVSVKRDDKDKTLKVVFGVEEKDETGDVKTARYNAMKDLCNKLPSNNKERSKKIQETLKKHGFEGDPGKWGVEITTQVFGFLEYDYVNEKILDSGLIIAFKGEGELKWYPAFGGGVVYMKATLELGADGEFVFKFEDKNLNIEAEITAEQLLGVGVGAGWEYVYVEVGFQGGLEEKIRYPFISAKESLEVNLVGKLYVEAKCFIFKGETEANFPDMPLWPNKGGKSVNTYGIERNVSKNRFDLDEFEVSDRDYLRTAKGRSLSKGIESDSVYPDGTPQICILEDGSYLAVWIADDGSKSSLNRTTLMYAVHQNGTWTDPKAVCETGRADFAPSLYEVGNRAYVAWINIGKELEDTAEPEEMLANTQVCVSVFENGEFSEPQYLTTDDEKMKMNIRVTADEENVAVLWVENSANDPFFAEGTNAIYLKAYKNGVWSEELCLLENLVAVTDMEAVYKDGDLNIGYIADYDKDITTTDDSEIFLYQNGENIRVTSDQKSDTNLCFVKDSMYWLANGELMRVQGANLHTLASMELENVSSFKVVSNGEEEVIICLASNGFYNELYKVEAGEEECSAPVPITDFGKHIEDYALVYGKDHSISGIVYETEVIDSESGSPYGFTALRVYENLRVSNVVLEDFYVDETTLQAGMDLPVILYVYNGGSQPLDSVQVTMKKDGTVMKEEIISCNIDPDSDARLECTYPSGDFLARHDLTIEITPLSFTDSKTQDNAVTQTIALADIAIEDAVITMTDTGAEISGKLVNRGFGESENISLTVLEDTAQGNTVYTNVYGSLAAGAETSFFCELSREYFDFEDENAAKYFYLLCDSDTEEGQYDNNSGVVTAFPIRVTDVFLAPESLEMKVNEQHTLEAAVIPRDAKNPDLYFTSDNCEVAVVTEEGIVLAVGEGTAVITAISADGGFAKSCTVTVEAGEEMLYQLEETEIQINRGETKKLSVLNEAGVPVSEEILSSVVYSTGDSAVATVAEDGTITAMSAGVTNICASIEDKFTAICMVEVIDRELQSIGFTETECTIVVGEEPKQLEVIYTPTDTITTKVLDWSSDNDAVATVDEAGNITGVAKGVAIITATSANGKEAKCMISVEEPVTYTVSFDPDTGAQPEEITGIYYGDVVTLPQAPVKEGYRFIGWFTQPNGKGVQVVDSVIVTEDITLYAYWTYGTKFEEYTVEDIPEQVYTGTALKPLPVVLDGTKTLVLGKDYTLSYKNNTKVGKGQIIVKGKGNYTKQMNLLFDIVPKNIEDEDIVISCADKLYNGNKQVSNPVVKWGKKTLKKGTDYTVTFSEDQISAGTVTVTITGINNYKGVRNTIYRIAAGNIQKAYVESIPAQTYEGSEIKPLVNVFVKKGGEKLTETIDYEVSYKNNENAGTGVVTITGIGTYMGKKDIKFTIGRKMIASEDISVSVLNEKLPYTGTAQKPEIVVQDGSTLLQEGSDYTLSYKNNINVKGKTDKNAPTITITGKGNYQGSKTEYFSIQQRPITETAITVTVSDMKYTGKEVKPSVTVKDGTKTLKKGRDYQISYENNISLAEKEDTNAPAVMITGMGNYTGKRSESFRIYAGAASVFDVKKISTQTYTGEEIEPEVEVYDKTSKALLEKDIHYTVSYDNNVNKGTGKIIIEGIGLYGGSKNVTFKIQAKPVTDGTVDKRLNVEEMVFTSSALKPGIVVKDNDVILKDGVDYTISYRNNVNAREKDNKNAPTVIVKGKGNYTGSVEIPFTITPMDITGDEMIAVMVNDIRYTGKALKPSVKVTNGAKKMSNNKDYTVQYENNTNMAEANGAVPPTVIITGKGNYKGEIKEYFRIFEKEISKMYVEKVGNELYTGKEIKPLPGVKETSKANGYLSDGSDYTVTYEDNVKIGKGKIIIHGKGKYGGTKKVTFTILPKWLKWFSL